MSLLTRLTHESARLLLTTQRYVTQLPRASSGNRPSVYLTFDDGPHPERTERILDQFAANGGKATFFVIGRRARRHPSMLRRILNEGHSIGSHTWRHWSARHLSSEDYLADVRRNRDEIEQITGHKTDLFRPPYGELTPRTLMKLVLDGFRIIHWTHDTRDLQLPSIQHLRQRFSEDLLVDGDIVLMHDDCCVTSYALGECLNAWGAGVNFLPIPMKSQYHAQTSSGLKSPQSQNPVTTEQSPVGIGSQSNSEQWGSL